jgi:CheY-like chemotaxis protein
VSFPLFSRPGAVAVVDDDPEFLAMLAGVLQRTWDCWFFCDPHQFLHHVESEAPLFEVDIGAQQQVVHRWAEGERLVPGILDYWTRSIERFALTRVCVVDRKMPLDGFEVLERLRFWDGYKLLLTGHVDNTEAVAAFNAGLIDKFLAKQSATLLQSLSAAIGTLQSKGMPRMDQIWRSTLSPYHAAMISRAPAARELASWTRERFVEYIVIGSPFGVLGVSAAGELGWIQLEEADAHHSPEISDALIRAEFGLAETVVSTRVRTLGDAGLRGAYFPLDWAPGGDRRDWTYRAWLKISLASLND